MKKRILSILLVLVMVIGMIPFSALSASADATGDAPTEVHLPYDYMEMEVGDRYECAINMVPTTANPSLVNLTSSDPTVVFASGKELIALKEGEVTVTATTISGVTDTMKVKVVSEFLTATNQMKAIHFHEDGGSTSAMYRIGVGNKIPKPADPTKEGYVFCGWYEDNMLGTGFANLWLFDSETVEETDEDIIDLYAKFVPEADFVPTTELSFVIDGEETGEKTLDIKLKSTYPIQVNQTPNNATIDVASWTVSDPNVLSITPAGFDGDYSTMARIECFKPGTVTITATIGTLTKSCTITVVDTSVYPDSVTLNYDECEVFKGTESAKLVATLTPNNVDSNAKTLTWTSSDEEVLGLTVDSDTLSASLVAKKVGTATVTVTTKDGKHSDTCVVTVTDTLNFELNGYLPGGNVSDISVTGPSQTYSTQQYKLYYSGAEVTDKISDKIKYQLEFLFVCDPSVLDTLTTEKIKLGELTATQLVRSGSNNARVTFELPALEYVEIDNLDIYITPPIAGQIPATTITETSGQVTATKVWWVPGTDSDWVPSSQFVEGDTYYLQITLQANPGYIFPVIDINNYNDIKTGYKINGVEVEAFSHTPGQRAQTIGPFCEFTALPPHTHTYTNSVIQKDDTYHWLECDASNCPDKLGSRKDVAAHTPNADDGDCTTPITCVCGEVMTAGATSHIGGTATCTAKAKCNVCGKEYGETLAHTHGTEWKNDADNHWNECACGDKANVAAHADANSDEKCDVCGYAMPKAPSDNETEKPTEKPTDATDKPTDATEGEKDDETEAPADKGCGGCGSSAALSALAIVAVVGSALVIKKKED